MGMDERRMPPVQMKDGKSIQLLATARAPYKITIPDGLTGHHHLQPDHHVFVLLDESSSYTTS